MEHTDEFEHWWDTLSEDEQDVIDRSVGLLEDKGPSLDYPYCSGVRQSRRRAILLIGGDKTDKDDFYDKMVPKADKIYDEYLKETEEENNG